MIESNLIVRGGDTPLLPDDTGPGPTTLIGGNATSGFFGEVPVSELIDGDSLASLVALTAGNVHYSTAPWLKFILDGEILFVAKKPYRSYLNWNSLNTANAVYGDRIIDIKGYQFRVSLLKGLNPDPSVPFVSSSYDNECSWNSEWNRLMYYVASDEGVIEARKKHSQVGPNWANYPQDDSADGLVSTGSIGGGSWCQDRNPDLSNARIVRGTNGVTFLFNYPAPNAGSTYGWRPCLRLVQ